jgi:hypothetical protein
MLMVGATCSISSFIVLYASIPVDCCCCKAALLHCTALHCTALHCTGTIAASSACVTSQHVEGVIRSSAQANHLCCVQVRLLPRTSLPAAHPCSHPSRRHRLSSLLAAHPASQVRASPLAASSTVDPYWTNACGAPECCAGLCDADMCYACSVLPLEL